MQAYKHKHKRKHSDTKLSFFLCLFLCLFSQILSENKPQHKHKEICYILLYLVSFSTRPSHPHVDFDEKFSKVVRNYRVLYDKKCQDFKNKNKKNWVWTQVSKEKHKTKGNMNGVQYCISVELFRFRT